jgi:hypothetical protein
MSSWAVAQSNDPCISVATNELHWPAASRKHGGDHGCWPESSWN